VAGLTETRYTDNDVFVLHLGGASADKLPLCFTME
jgi:hypothetical protein